MKPKVIPFAFLAAFAAALTASSCGGKSDEALPAAAQGDERLSAMGRQALEDKKWTEARGYFQQLIDSYPRSQLAGDARLGIADSYFNQSGSGNLILAIAEYRDFLTFFPNHPRADYAQFQIASGHYRQVRSPDRDQEPTELAVEEFEKLIELYRNSRYAEEGREILEECYERLAESEFNIGWFYLKTRKHCRASIPRFQKVVDDLPFVHEDGRRPIQTRRGPARLSPAVRGAASFRAGRQQLPRQRVPRRGPSHPHHDGEGAHRRGESQIAPDFPLTKPVFHGTLPNPAFGDLQEAL